MPVHHVSSAVHEFATFWVTWGDERDRVNGTDERFSSVHRRLLLPFNS